MALKFDRQKTRQQLLHASISLAIILFCMSYTHYRGNWTHMGTLRDSLIVPIVLIGEVLKIILTRYYGRHYDYENTQQKHQRLMKKSTSSAVKDILISLLMQVICCILYGFICIILGAPILQNYEQTLVLSLILTLFTVSPLVFLVGGTGALQVCFCERNDLLSKSEECALEMYKYNALGGLVGAWAASVVSPLDWDRDWQEYPIPNVVGALLGSALGNIFACSRVLYTTAKVYLNKKN